GCVGAARLGMRPKHNVEPSLPGLARVGGHDGGLADATVDRLPDSANAPFFAVSGVVGAGQDHSAGLKFAFNDQQLAAIGGPALVPDASGRVVESETLPVHSGCGFVV